MSRTSKPAAKSAEEIKAERKAALASERVRLAIESASNPHGFFTFEECGLILGFSFKAMGRLSGAGAPVLFRKMNPAMVCRWVYENPDLVSKIGEGDDE